MMKVAKDQGELAWSFFESSMLFVSTVAKNELSRCSQTDSGLVSLRMLPTCCRGHCFGSVSKSDWLVVSL